MSKRKREKYGKNYSTPYEMEGKLPLKQAIPLGLQHVLAMFVGNLIYGNQLRFYRSV